MAVEAYFDAETVWVSEIDKHANKVIEQRINKPNLGDLKVINWAEVEPIDILTAGYPCQPFSTAGSRKGENDERHIWPYIKESIGYLRPAYVILENVAGHLSLGFSQVLADLTEIGYDARWEIIRASDVGAPHRRERLFIIAYPNSRIRRVSSPDEVATNTQSGWTGNEPSGISTCNSRACSCSESAADTEGQRSGRQTKSISRQSSEPGGDIPFITNTNTDCDAHAQPRRTNRSVSTAGRGLPTGQDEGKTGSKYRSSAEMAQQELPDTLDHDGKLNPVFVEYMMGLPTGWVTDCDLARTNKLKILGNGVVPQQAYHAISLIMETVVQT